MFIDNEEQKKQYLPKSKPKNVVAKAIEGVTRREFLKEFLKRSAQATLLYFFYKLNEGVLADAGRAIGCLTSKDIKTFNGVQKELKPTYDTALIVVHAGYGLLRDPDRFSKDKNYLEYLQRLKQQISESREKGDLIIFLMGSEDVAVGRSSLGLNYTDADMAVITGSDNPQPIACIQKPNGEYLYQDTFALYDTLKQKSVKTVEIAGEFKGACVAQAKQLVGKLNPVLLDNVIFDPVVDK